MATMNDLASNVADMLRRPSDTNTIGQAKAEIRNAVDHYSRRATWVVEHRGGTIAATSGNQWYSTIDLTAGTDIEAGSPAATLRTSTDSLKKLLNITYAKIEQGTVDWPLEILPVRDFEHLSETSGISGTPRWITHHVGQVGLWPVPGAAYTVYISGYFKPTAPVNDADESVWFDEYRELIENAAARRVASKWLQDTEMAGVFAQEEGLQAGLLIAEGAAKRATGKLRAHTL